MLLLLFGQMFCYWCCGLVAAGLAFFDGVPAKQRMDSGAAAVRVIGSHGDGGADVADLLPYQMLPCWQAAILLLYFPSERLFDGDY